VGVGFGVLVGAAVGRGVGRAVGSVTGVPNGTSLGVAEAVAMLADGLVRSGDAAGVPVPASSPWAGVSLVNATPSDARAPTISCDAPIPITTARSITPAAAAAKRPARIRPPGSSSTPSQNGIFARPGSISPSRSMAAMERMHSGHTDACSARSRGGSPKAPAASQAANRAWGSFMAIEGLPRGLSRQPAALAAPARQELAGSRATRPARQPTGSQHVPAQPSDARPLGPCPGSFRRRSLRSPRSPRPPARRAPGSRAPPARRRPGLQPQGGRGWLGALPR
jgi:hypothetical protein